VTKLRTDHPTFRRRRFFHGRPVRRGQGEPVPDIDWLTPSGDSMTDEDWDVGFAKSLAVYLNGHGIRETDERGERIVDDCFYLAFNAHHEPMEFALPGSDYATAWTVVLDTAEHGDLEHDDLKPGETVTVGARATVVLRAAACRPASLRPPTGCRSTPGSASTTPPPSPATWPTSG
jgi:glycogen operon protein